MLIPPQMETRQYDTLEKERVSNEVIGMEYFRSFIHYYEYHQGNKSALDLNYIVQAKGMNAFNEITTKIGLRV